jgi:hypothetical protein
MSRRLLTAGLATAVLLSVLGWAGRATAKPPDLPLTDKNELAPQTPPAPQPAAVPFADAPAMEAPSFTMRPSARRMLARCLLYGVHPLLTLAPTDEYFNFDDEDAPADPVVNTAPVVQEGTHGSITISVGVSTDAGLTGSIEITTARAEPADCVPVLQACWRLLMHAVEQPAQDVELMQCGDSTGFHLVPFVDGGAVAPEKTCPGAPAESVCPWMREHAAPRQEEPAADFDAAHDVLHNLQMLRQAHALLEDAREFGRAGRVGDALECLDLVRTLCPGSRLDDAVQQTAAELFAPFFCGSPAPAAGGEEGSEPAPILSNHPQSRNSEKVHAIETKLSQPVTMKFEDAPLRQVIDDIQASEGIHIHVDRDALDEKGISLESPVSVRVENVALRSALKLILEEVHLACVVKDEVLQVTTEGNARGKMESVAYQVADLVVPRPDGTGRKMPSVEAKADAFMRLITTSVCPETWSDRGGPGSIDYHPLTMSVVINQPPDVQEQVAAFLAALRQWDNAAPAECEESRPAEDAPPASVTPCPPPVPPQSRLFHKSEKEREIEQKLKQPVTLHFHDAPLSDVIDDLRSCQGVNIYVDKAALEAEEISLDRPVSVEFDDVSLRSALNLILKQVHLSFVVKDEVLQITTERGARGKMTRVVYKVADLVDGDPHRPGTPAGKDEEPPEAALMKLVTSTVCPHEWSVNGGPGTIDFHPQTRSLVVNQTPDVQEQVVDVLDALRRLKQGAEAGACEKCGDARPATEDDPTPADITPCLPPVDPDTPAALDQLLREQEVFGPPDASRLQEIKKADYERVEGGLEDEPAANGWKGAAKPFRKADGLKDVGCGKDGGEDAPESYEFLPHSSFEFGFGLDGSVQMFTQLRRGGAVWHLYYGNGGLSVWASPTVGDDASAD